MGERKEKMKERMKEAKLCYHHQVTPSQESISGIADQPAHDGNGVVAGIALGLDEILNQTDQLSGL